MSSYIVGFGVLDDPNSTFSQSLNNKRENLKIKDFQFSHVALCATNNVLLLYNRKEFK